MFVVRKILNTVTGVAPNPELINIHSGRLFLIRPGETLKGRKECIFIEASCSIRRTGTEHQYQLVATRAYGEGEEGLLDEDAENDMERPFLIDEDIKFVLYDAAPEPGDPPVPTLSWEDLAGDQGDRFEFACTDESTNAATLELFETMVFRCMWERKYRRDSAQAEDEELEAFRISPKDLPTPAATPSESPTGKKLFRSPSPDSDDEVAAQLSRLRMSVSNPIPASSPQALSKKDGGESRDSLAAEIASGQLEPSQIRSDADKAPDMAAGTIMWTQECAVRLFDTEIGVFQLVDDKAQATLWVPNRPKDLCWLAVLSSAGHEVGAWVSTELGSEQNLAFTPSKRALTFNYTYERKGPSGNTERDPYTWLLEFASNDDFNVMQNAFTQCLFERAEGVGKWASAKEADRQYVREAYIDDIEMYSVEEQGEEEEGDEDAEEETESEEETSEEETEESEEEAAKFRSAKGRASKGKTPAAKRKGTDHGPKNSQLAVGYKDDLSFVVRGSMIGIFQSDPTGQKKLKFMTSITGMTTPDGKQVLEPDKIMLHNQDSVLVLKNPHNPNSLYHLDLTTGRVVDEWKIGKNIEVTNFTPTTKFAQMNPEQTFIGNSHNSLFRVDPRLGREKLVTSEFKQYSTKVDFSAVATTESGMICVVSNKGDIRLYDTIGKIAKTTLPSLGDRIIAADCTADGKYVVATCKTYLLFFDTTIQDGKYQGQLGFTRSFPADSRPKPLKLRLKPEHTSYMNHDVSFTPAKFNQGPGEMEKTIVTSTGPYIIAFNLRRVKMGKTSDYTIKMYGESIVADAFRFGNDKDIVVTMPGDVFMESKNKLLRPTRESLAPGAHAGDGIVRKWQG